MASRIAHAQAASATGTARGAMHGSCPSADGEFRVAMRVEVDAALRLADRRRWLNRHPPDERRSTGDAAEDAAGMVGGHMRTPVLHAKRVVMLAPAHEGGPKSLAEFDPLHAGDAERDAGDAVLHAVEHGVAKACGDVVCHTFNHGTQAVEPRILPGEWPRACAVRPRRRCRVAGLRLWRQAALRRAPWG